MKAFDKFTLSVLGLFLLSLGFSHWSSNESAEVLPVVGEKGRMKGALVKGIGVADRVEPIIYPAGALKGELIIRVVDVALLKRLENEYGFVYISGIPELGYARIRVKEGTCQDFLAGLNLTEEDWSYNYPLAAIDDELTEDPRLAQEGPSEAAFAYALLDWMGLSNVDLSTKGQGVRIAFLDSGFEADWSIDLLPDDGFWSTELHSHAHWMKTMCSGSANGSFSGIAPEAELMSVKVLDASGRGDVFTLATGIVMAAQEGANVINLSLGSAYGDDVLKDAVQFAYDSGVLLLGAVGNEGAGQISYPAAYPEVLAVAAINADNQRASFSNYGEGVDLASPGVGVLTEDAEGRPWLLSGTSIATAVTSATAAMVWSDDLTLTNEDLVDLLLDKTRDVGVLGYDTEYGYGILEPSRLMRWADTHYTDLGIIGVYLDSNPLRTAYPRLKVRIQNLGNTPIYGIQTFCRINGAPRIFSMGMLGVSEAHEFSIYPHRYELKKDEGLELLVSVSSSGNDHQAKNNNWKGILKLKVSE